MAVISIFESASQFICQEFFDEFAFMGASADNRERMYAGVVQETDLACIIRITFRENPGTTINTFQVVINAMINGVASNNKTYFYDSGRFGGFGTPVGKVDDEAIKLFTHHSESMREKYTDHILHNNELREIAFPEQPDTTVDKNGKWVYKTREQTIEALMDDCVLLRDSLSSRVKNKITLNSYLSNNNQFADKEQEFFYEVHKLMIQIMRLRDEAVARSSASLTPESLSIMRKKQNKTVELQEHLAKKFNRIKNLIGEQVYLAT